ncbi:MAG: MarR family transcriptional regulator [Lachnospiraceae bacterium]|nr:MarR family transcriptional regulator [Lachnospiraceae bacterium]MBQ9606109.1 MarR family transcriptional regulator [Lachnospiraceae bacterium]MBR1524718.1 MarR family transcriptional regulator [Lachnospiraceae bacterium]
MEKGLLSLFTEDDFEQDINGAAYSLADIISLSYVMNKSTGERFARAVLEDGTTLIKPALTRSGSADIEHVIPPYRTTAERNAVISELADDPDLTQEMIAAMMDISQSTVSNVLRNS